MGPTLTDIAPTASHAIALSTHELAWAVLGRLKAERSPPTSGNFALSL